MTMIVYLIFQESYFPHKKKHYINSVLKIYTATIYTFSLLSKPELVKSSKDRDSTKKTGFGNLSGKMRNFSKILP